MSIKAIPQVFPPTVCLRLGASVLDALRLMLDKDVNHIPVCSEDNVFVGIVSTNQILLELIPASARVEHRLQNLKFAGDAMPMLTARLNELERCEVGWVAQKGIHPHSGSVAAADSEQGTPAGAGLGWTGPRHTSPARPARVMRKTISYLVLGIWTALSLGVVAAFAGTAPPAPKRTMLAQGMGGMGGGRQAMMQRFWGNRLLQGIAPSLLPAPDTFGARLLTTYCTQCHGLPGPGLHTAAEWPQVLERMDMRMRTMGGGMMGGGMMGRGVAGVAIPAAAEWKTLLEYLEQYAQRPMDAAHYPDLNTPAGKAISTFCTRCHAMPDPHQHSAKDWPAVVGRMRSYMGPMGKALPDEATTKQIIGFLQQHSGTGK